MSILTKKNLLERLASGNVTFKPQLDTFQIQSHAIDLRLGFTFLIPKMWQITKHGREALNIDHFDKNRPPYFETVELEQGQHFDLLPGEYVLVSTLESMKVPNDLMAILFPRSSTNRKGLSVDLTGIVDSGYEGQLAIPVRNNTAHQTVRLYPGERFCQVVFEKLDEEIDVEHSRYHRKDIIDGFVRNKKATPDDEKEIELLLQGDIKALKEQFKI